MKLHLVAALLLALGSTAQAADNAIVLTPGTGVTERSKDVGSGVQSVVVILGDTSGAPLATAPGTGNTVFAVPIQGVSGGVAVPVSGTVSISGSTSNASSGVATGSTNVPTVGYGYGFNGTTWDQLQVDASKNLKVVGAGLTQAATTSGTSFSAIGCGAVNAEQTAVTNGQLSRCVMDLVGKIITMPFANKENFLNGQITSAMTGTSSTAVTGMAAQGSGVKVYVTGCTFSNSHATQGTMILLQNGTGGATLWQAPAAPAFGGAQVTFTPPLATSANTGLFAANVTTGANTFLSCTGYAGT